jgi:hypothetical protein
MPTVEMDEVELQRLRKQDQTVHALMSNPKAKKKIFEAYKEANPDARIPELELEEAAKAPVVQLEKTVSDLQKQLLEDKAEREKETRLNSLNTSMERGFAKLRSQGWLDDGIENVKKLMEEKGYLDPEDAAAIYLSKNPPPAPATPSGSGSWGFMEPPADDDAYIKALTTGKGAADNEQLVMQEARKTLQEFRGAQRR